MHSNDIVRLPASRASAQADDCGQVWLVGAGPGDPDLLTLKALRAIESADVILYDKLVSKEIRALFPRKTPAFYVGKEKGRHSVPQDELNQLLVAQASQGLKVCRLKGGDAFVFGRGGEEMLVLQRAGIAVEVVPGITAASGCSTYAGIPLTHRGLSQGCTLVTAHAEKRLDVDWHALARLDHTLVFYMGLSRAGLISERLCGAGLDGDTPVALIENGCCPQQRVVRGRLADLATLVAAEQVAAPALIVVGRVVDLAQSLSWYRGLARDAGADAQQQQKLTA